MDAYDKEVNWLQQQDPPVDNPFPVFVKRKIFETRALNSGPSAVFWQTLRTSDVTALLGGTPESIEGLQLELFSGKILSILEDTSANAPASLSSLAATFASVASDFPRENGILHKEVKH